MSQIVDFSALPPPSVIEEISFDAILAERKEWLIAQYPADEQDAVRRTLALESEPATKLLRESAYREVVFRQRVNEAALAVMLPYANGADLDVLAGNLNTERKVIRPADLEAMPPVPAVLEQNDEFRYRAQQAYEGLSVAGPTGAYEFHATSADARVLDVKAVSPAPCEAVIYVMARDGDGTAQTDLLQAVETALSDEDIRPVGDRVTVLSVSVAVFQIMATLYLYPGPEVELVLAAAEKSLQAYIAKQRKIGRAIRRSAIFAALHVEGVRRVELASPAADIVLDYSQVGYCSEYQINYGGRDD